MSEHIEDVSEVDSSGHHDAARGKELQTDKKSFQNVLPRLRRRAADLRIERRRVAQLPPPLEAPRSMTES